MGGGARRGSSDGKLHWGKISKTGEIQWYISEEESRLDLAGA